MSNYHNQELNITIYNEHEHVSLSTKSNNKANKTTNKHKLVHDYHLSIKKLKHVKDWYIKIDVVKGLHVLI